MIPVDLKRLKAHLIAALETEARVIRSLGECYWTGAVDNTFGQPKPAS